MRSIMYTYSKGLIKALIFTIAISFCLNSTAQSFVNTNQPFIGLNVGTAAWGDIDNDGDLDVALAGWPNGPVIGYTGIWYNDNGTYTELNLTLPPMLGTNWSWNLLTWEDYNNDNLLDLAQVGQDTNGNMIAKLWANQGNLSFWNSFDFPPGTYNKPIWGDVDNDGDKDLLLLGHDDANGVSALWLNNTNQGNNTFTLSTQVIPGTEFANGAFGDYDADGDIDLVTIGLDSAQIPTTMLWDNDGTGSFTHNANPPFLNVFNGDVDWADVDNDGDLDLMLSGNTDTAGTLMSSIYYYDSQAGAFNSMLSGIQALGGSGTSLGDYNHDGLVDLVALGDTTLGYNPKTRVYYGAAGGQAMIEDPAINVLDLLQGSPSWLDYDGDGDLDLFIIGLDQTGQGQTRLYEAQGFPMNQPPATPAGLSSAPVGNDAVQFSWTAPQDDVTPSIALTYHLMLDTISGGYGLGSPLADTATGNRHIASLGDIVGTSWTMRNIDIGASYCFRVSAIDGSLAGSDFSESACGFIVGIADDLTTYSLNAWPIPAQNELNLSLEGISGRGLVQVLSIDGKVMLEEKVNNFASHKLNIGHLSTGMYLLRAKLDGESKATILRFTKQ